jgi:hypothetical protein
MRQLRIGVKGGSKAHFERADAPNTDPLPQSDRLAFCLEPARDNSSGAYTCLSPHDGTLHVAPEDSAYSSYASFAPERYQALAI